MASTEHEKPKRKLSKKQKGFIADYIETGNATEAVVRNYDVKDRIVAKSVGTENLAKPSIQQEIANYASRIPDDLLERVHLEGLSAHDREATLDGEMVEVPDYAVRHKYLDSAYKLKGMYAPEKSVNLNIEIPSNSDPELEKIRAEFNEKAKQKIIDKIKSNE